MIIIDPKCNITQLTFALVGNPNVGKSTLFNLLTNGNQHTGNWSGKTIDIAKAHFNHVNHKINLIDLPGTLSLHSDSKEEQVTSDYIMNNNYDTLIIVVNSTALHRSLLLTLQTLMYTQKAVICLNMTDEAEKLGVIIDTDELELQLGVPLIKISASNSYNISSLLNTAVTVATGAKKTFCLKKLIDLRESDYTESEEAEKLNLIADEIVKHTIKNDKSVHTKTSKTLDKIFTSKLTGIPILLLVFCSLFWITAYGANYPSEILFDIFINITESVRIILYSINTPQIIVNILTDGILTTVSWVISVMLPPSAIFFTLFALLEESGYLPRIAFILDSIFKPTGTNGKLSLTMLMGFGCNACGVMGCRINSSKKEQIIASITNSFVPCNGRLPTLIAISSLYFTNNLTGTTKSFAVAGILLITLICSTIMTLAVSLVLSKTTFRKCNSTFTLELPNYRIPKFALVIKKTIKEKILYVLSRAILVSVPAGIVLWIITNCSIKGTSILIHITTFIDPIANAIGLDGIILTAFLLSFPANEIVIPIILMAYTNGNLLTDYSSITQLGVILSQNGWKLSTAICFCIFTLFHFPCSTTCFAIQKETRSIRWTLVSIFIPLFIGFALCYLVNLTLC